MTDFTQLNKKTRIQAVAIIAGQTYRTAEKAAAAWALWCRIRRSERHGQKLGHAAYHDAAWESRTRAFDARAQRRALKIFQKYLS
jgi:hypothetical protein